MSNTFFAELRTAINERLGVLNAGPGTYSSETKRAKRWYGDIVAMRNYISTLITPGGVGGADLCFLKSDLSTWSGVSELLIAAGYGSGVWINLNTGTRLDLHTVVKQVQDALLQLVKYKFRVSATSVRTWASGSGRQTGSSALSHEVAWDNMRADTPDDTDYNVIEFGVALPHWWNDRPDFGSNFASGGLRMKNSYTFPTHLKGDLIKFVVKVAGGDGFGTIGAEAYLSSTITAGVDVGASTFTYDIDPNSGINDELEITSGISFDGNNIDFEYYMPDFPTDSPYNFSDIAAEHGETVFHIGDIGGGLSNLYAELSVGNGLTYG